MNYKITIFKNEEEHEDLIASAEVKIIRSFIKKYHNGKIDLTVVTVDGVRPTQFLYRIDKNINLNKIINKKMLVDSIENGYDKTDKLEILIEKVQNTKNKFRLFSTDEDKDFNNHQELTEDEDSKKESLKEESKEDSKEASLKEDSKEESLKEDSKKEDSKKKSSKKNSKKKSSSKLAKNCTNSLTFFQ